MTESAFEELVIQSLKEVKAEVVAVGTVAQQGLTIATKTLEQAERTNGRVDVLEHQQRSHVDFHLAAERDEDNAQSYEAGRKSVRDGDRALFQKCMSWLPTKVWIALAGLATGGVGARLAAWLLGVKW